MHQEDACQLLDRYPADKYRLGWRDIAEALEVCTAPVVERLGLLRLVAFSYAIANGDLHGKNVSVREAATRRMLGRVIRAVGRALSRVGEIGLAERRADDLRRELGRRLERIDPASRPRPLHGSSASVPDVPFAWLDDPYRGCAHASIRCYPRATPRYRDQGAGTDIETKPAVKRNAPEWTALHTRRRNETTPAPSSTVRASSCWWAILDSNQ